MKSNENKDYLEILKSVKPNILKIRDAVEKETKSFIEYIEETNLACVQISPTETVGWVL